MITAVSTNIRSIDYDSNSQELTVIFNSRPRLRYLYFRVPPKTWVAFVRSESKGQFFADRIKDVYSYKIIRQ